MKTLEQIASSIAELKSVLIFCHTRPDGDTLGSALALSLALKRKGIISDIVCDGVVPAKYAFIKGFNAVLTPQQVDKTYEGHVAVDVATEQLLGASWGLYAASKKRICIDHHLSNERYTRDCYVRGCAAAVIIVKELIELLDIDVDKDIATALLLGLMTDTGNFSHNNVDGEVLYVASELVKAGADIYSIGYNVFKRQSKERALLQGEAICGMRFFLDQRLAVITVTDQMLKNKNLTAEATEGLVDYPLTIDGVEVSVALLETKKELYKASFRSKGRVNVNHVASEFGGGGHAFASGAVIAGPYEEVIEKVVRATDVNMVL